MLTPAEYAEREKLEAKAYYADDPLEAKIWESMLAAWDMVRFLQQKPLEPLESEER